MPLQQRVLHDRRRWWAPKRAVVRGAQHANQSSVVARRAKADRAADLEQRLRHSSRRVPRPGLELVSDSEPSSGRDGGGEKLSAGVVRGRALQRVHRGVDAAAVGNHTWVACRQVQRPATPATRRLIHVPRRIGQLPHEAKNALSRAEAAHAVAAREPLRVAEFNVPADMLGYRITDVRFGRHRSLGHRGCLYTATSAMCRPRNS